MTAPSRYADVAAWAGPPDDAAAARLQKQREENDLRASTILKADLPKYLPEDKQQLAEPASRAAVQGWLWRSGPYGSLPSPSLAKQAIGEAAAAVESKHGRLEDVPGFRNGGEYSQAALNWQKDHPGLFADSSSRHVMAPGQYQYMQGPGRLLDLLRNYGSQPETAMDYWDKSNFATTSRNDIPDPNYQRFAGPERAMHFFGGHPISPIGRYLSLAQSGMRALFHRGETDNWTDAAHMAATAHQIPNQVWVGENPIMDLPSPTGDESFADRRNASQQYGKRVGEWAAAQGTVVPPSNVHASVNLVGKPLLGLTGGRFGFDMAPQFTGDLFELYTGAADPQMAGSMLTGGAGLLAGLAKKLPQHAAEKGAARAAASYAGNAMKGLAGMTAGEVAGDSAISAPMMAASSAMGSEDGSWFDPKGWYDYATKLKAPEYRPTDKILKAADRVQAAMRENGAGNGQDIWGTWHRARPLGDTLAPAMTAQ